MKPQRADSIFVGTFSEIEAAIKGNPYHDEITALLARAESFCADIPEGDNRRVLVPTIKQLCGLIPGELHFAAALPNIPEQKRMMAESSRRLDAMLGKVRELLIQAQALGLAQEIGKWREGARRKSLAANEVKIGNAKSKTRQVAALWLHECKQSPDALADEIGQKVKAKLGIKSQTTLDNHLRNARKLKLIPLRHRRQK